MKHRITTGNSLAPKLKWIYNSKVAWRWCEFVCFYDSNTWSRDLNTKFTP